MNQPLLELYYYTQTISIFLVFFTASDTDTSQSCLNLRVRYQSSYHLEVILFCSFKLSSQSDNSLAIILEMSQSVPLQLYFIAVESRYHLRVVLISESFGQSSYHLQLCSKTVDSSYQQDRKDRIGVLISETSLSILLELSYSVHLNYPLNQTTVQLSSWSCLSLLSSYHPIIFLMRFLQLKSHYLCQMLCWKLKRIPSPMARDQDMGRVPMLGSGSCTKDLRCKEAVIGIRMFHNY